MESSSSQKSLLVLFSVLSAVISLTYFLSILARGYQPDFRHGLKLKATGLLSATSKPKSASVFIDSRLVTATDDTLNLTPDNYQVTIAKDGFFPWSKLIKIQQEMVYQTDAILFRSPPVLKSLPFDQITNFAVNFDRDLLVFSNHQGLFLIDSSVFPITLGKNSPKLLATSSPTLDWTSFSLSFSPNSKQVLAQSKTKNIAYLLSLDQNNQPANPKNVSSLLPTIKNDWQKQLDQLITSRLDRTPISLRPNIATSSAIFFSEDDSKLLYQDTNDTLFVYDSEKEQEYKIGPKSGFNFISWLPNSHCLVYENDQQQVETIEFDGSNRINLYSAPFLTGSILPWSDGNKLFLINQSLFSLSIR